MAELNDKQQIAYQKVLDATTPDEIRSALDAFSELLPSASSKRSQVADLVIGEIRAPSTHPPKVLSRLITLLATIDTPNAAAVVADFADPDPTECDDRIQVWALTSLAKMSAHDDACAVMQKAVEQDGANPRIQALALRLLIHCVGDDFEAIREPIDGLVALAQGGKADDKWAVLRALRADTSLSPLSPDVEFRFIIEVMAPALRDDFEWLDVQLQAALALGDVVHHPDEAMVHLAAAYQASPISTVRRYCIESMRKAADSIKRTQGQSLDHNQFTAIMLLALDDDSSDVRFRAQAALRAICKPRGAVDLIIGSMVTAEKTRAGFVDALRQIDERYASNALRDKLLDADPEVVERAMNALTELGGVQAFRTLFAQKRQAIEQYTHILNDADEKIMAQYDSLMGQARWAFWIGSAMHATVFVVGIVILSVTFAIALTQSVSDGGTSPVASLFGMAGGVVAIALGLFYKSPFNNIAQSVNRLVKVNVAFLGYMRQINQVDATFKQLFLDTSGFGVEKMKETVEQIQAVVDHSLANVQRYLAEDDGADKGGVLASIATLSGSQPPDAQ